MPPSAAAPRQAANHVAAAQPASALAFANLQIDGDGSQATETREPADWLRFVPGGVGFYVEVRDLIGLRSSFQRHGIWHVIRELADPDRSTASQPTTPLPGLDPDLAISELIGRRGALFAEESSQWENGVLFAELGQRGEMHRWRERWHARRLPDAGPVECYVLDGGLRMAVLDRLLVLGPAEDSTELWMRSVRLISGVPGAHLRGESGFASLHARIRHAPTGLAFVSWKPGDPFAVSGLSRMVIGLDFRDSDLRFEIHGVGPGLAGPHPACDRDLLTHLPADTLMAWSGSFAPDVLTTEEGSGMAMSSLSPIGRILGYLNNLSTESGRLAEQIGPRVTVAIGPDPRTTDGSTLMVPSAAVIVDVRHVDEVTEQIGHVIEFVGGMARLAATSQSATTAPLTRMETVEDVPFRVLDIGRPLADRFSLPFLARVQIAWAGLEDRLLVTSSESQLRAMISSMRGRKPSLTRYATGQTTSAGAEGSGEIVQWSMMRGSRVSHILRNWLGYIRRNHPDAMHDQWWQAWAMERARMRTRFGVSLRDSHSAAGGAEVIDLEVNSPAQGHLRIGDVIVAVADRPLPTDAPAMAAAKRYADRGASLQFRLTVLREGRRLKLRIPVEPLPDRDIRDLEPMRALRQLVILLRNVDCITMIRRESRGSRLELEISVAWNPVSGANPDAPPGSKP